MQNSSGLWSSFTNADAGLQEFANEGLHLPEPFVGNRNPITEAFEMSGNDCNASDMQHSILQYSLHHLLIHIYLGRRLRLQNTAHWQNTISCHAIMLYCADSCCKQIPCCHKMALTWELCMQRPPRRTWKTCSAACGHARDLQQSPALPPRYLLRGELQLLRCRPLTDHRCQDWRKVQRRRQGRCSPALVRTCSCLCLLM